MANDNMIPNLRAVKNEADAAAVRAAPAIADEAALAGQPAGQYELTATSELVAWNGAAVTARGPMPASTTRTDNRLKPYMFTRPNDRAKLAQALAARPGEVDLGGAAWTLDDTLLLDHSRNALIGEGGVLEYTGPLDGRPALRFAAQAAWGLPLSTRQQSNIVLRGPWNFTEARTDSQQWANNGANCVGLELGRSDSRDYQGSGAVLNGWQIRGFKKGLLFGNRSYLHVFDKISMAQCEYAIYYPPGLYDSGERITIGEATIHDCQNAIYTNSGDFVIDTASFDYIHGSTFIAVGGGTIRAGDIHLESGHNQAPMMLAQDSGSFIKVDSMTFYAKGLSAENAAPLTRTQPIGRATSPDAGIFIDLLRFSKDTVYDNPAFIEGYGYVRHLLPFTAASLVIGSTALNHISDPRFEGAALSTLDWETPAVPPQVQDGQGRTGRGAVFGAEGNQRVYSVRKRIPVRPGDSLKCVYDLKVVATDPATTDRFHVGARWLTADKTRHPGLNVHTMERSYGPKYTPAPDWTHGAVMPYVPAPAGAAFVEFEFVLYSEGYGATAGGLTAYLDNVFIG